MTRLLRSLGSLAPDALLLRLAAAAAVVGVLAVAVPVLGDVGMLVAAAGVLVVLGVVIQWIWQSQGATDWSTTQPEPGTPRGADTRINRLVDDIQLAAAGDPAGTRRLHALLTTLATERLRDRRGLHLDGEGVPEVGGGEHHPPERDDRASARAALGADLAAYLDAPPATVAPARLAQFTTTLEDL